MKQWVAWNSQLKKSSFQKEVWHPRMKKHKTNTSSREFPIRGVVLPDVRRVLGAYRLLSSKSMCLSSLSCIESSAMRFSCVFTFCSKAALEEDAAEPSCETWAGTVCVDEHGGVVSHPPKKIPPSRTMTPGPGHGPLHKSLKLLLML